LVTVSTLSTWLNVALPAVTTGFTGSCDHAGAAA
jgi:hypothetical protein